MVIQVFRCLYWVLEFRRRMIYNHAKSWAATSNFYIYPQFQVLSDVDPQLFAVFCPYNREKPGSCETMHQLAEKPLKSRNKISNAVH